MGQVCGRCSASVADDARFCAACGAPLDTMEDAERKLGTMVFADLVGSTELATDLDPEELRQRLAPFFEVARATLEEHGGRVEKYVGDETDLYFSAVALKNGGFGKLFLRRDVSPVDQQDVIRQNRDTLYGSGVFDLNAGPVTVTLPDAGKRFISMQIINQNEYTWPAIYDSQPHTITKEQVGTRYVLLGFRILVDPNDPKDLQQARALQDAIKVEQPGGPGKFQVPKWDPVSQKKIRDALLALATTVNDTSRAFGTKEQVDPVQRLIGAASAWGANPPKDAIYLNVVPAKNDGTTVYKLTVRDVPVDGFWSVSRYNAQGYYEKNALDAYTINNITGKKSADGSVVIQFGGCDGNIPNCLPIGKGWNYMVRLYRPHAEILNGKWKFPEPQAVN